MPPRLRLRPPPDVTMSHRADFPNQRRERGRRPSKTMECSECGSEAERDELIEGHPFHCTHCGWFEDDDETDHEDVT